MFRNIKIEILQKYTRGLKKMTKTNIPLYFHLYFVNFILNNSFISSQTEKKSKSNNPKRNKYKF